MISTHGRTNALENVQRLEAVLPSAIATASVSVCVDGGVLCVGNVRREVMARARRTEQSLRTFYTKTHSVMAFN